jgi:integrase
MPEYHLVKDIVYPFMRASKAWKKQSTLRVQASDVKPIERIFAAHYVTHQPRDLCVHRKIVTGEVVAHYRERRKLEGVAPVTIARELSLASAACRYAISELNLDIPNPFAGRLISRVDRKKVRPRTRVMLDSEENPVLIALPQPARDMVLLFLETALRVNELRLLRHDQVDLEQGIVEFEPEEHKSGTFAGIALTPDAIDIIKRQPVVEGSPYVFNVNGRGVTENWWRGRWEKAREIAGLPDLQARDLRRTALTRWRRRYGLEAAQAQARHADRKTTERVYARSSVEIALEAVRSTAES